MMKIGELWKAKILQFIVLFCIEKNLGLSRNLCKVAFCVTGNVTTDCSKNSFIMMIDVSFA